MAECFAERGVLDARTNDPHFVLFALSAPVRLLDVADSDWVARAGGNAAISSGPRAVARDWARAIYRHYRGADAVAGIHYTCSIIPSARSIVLWDRARSALARRPLVHKSLTDPALHAELDVYATQLGLDYLP